MPHLKYWYGQVFSGCESAELLWAHFHQLAIFLSILATLAVVRKNAIHVSIFHSCGMTVEGGRRRAMFSPASLSTVLEFLTLWHILIPTTHLHKTPLTDMTCKITQEIRGGMSLLSPFLPLSSLGKASSSDIRSPGETVTSIWQPQTFSSLVAV